MSASCVLLVEDSWSLHRAAERSQSLRYRAGCVIRYRSGQPLADRSTSSSSTTHGLEVDGLRTFVGRRRLEVFPGVGVAVDEDDAGRLALLSFMVSLGSARTAPMSRMTLESSDLPYAHAPWPLIVVGPDHRFT